MLLSCTTRALLDVKDRPYTIITAIAALITIISVIVLSYFNMALINIGVSILVGEIFLLLGLRKISTIKNLMLPRLFFLFTNSLLLLIPYLSALFFKDDFVTYIISLITLSLALFFVNLKKIRLSPVANTTDG